eukprot:873085-Ditylum_brightwellii.AAC.1
MSTAATLCPPPAPPRQSPRHHRTPSPVKQANLKEGKKKQATPILKKRRSTQKEGMEEEIMGK